MTEHQLASPPKRRPVLRNGLIWTLGLLFLTGAVALLFLDSIRQKLAHNRARVHFAADRTDEAINQLRAAVLTGPTNLESLFLLVRGHRRAGDLPKASMLLNHIESLKGDTERIDLERKLIMVQTGRIRESEANLSSLLMKGGDAGSDALHAFVLGYFANLRTDEASELLDMWQQTTPNDPQAYFLKAYLLRSMRQFAGAIAQYRKGLSLAPQNQLMRERLAECLLEDSKFEEARTELNQIQSERSTELLRAKCDYAENNLASAKKLLDTYLEKTPENMEARTLRGRILVELDQPQQAAEDLQKVVDRVPTDVLAREALGRALVQLNRKTESEGHFDFVKRASQAQSDMSRLIRKSIAEPENIDVRFTIAQLATEFVSPEDGAKWMRTILEIQPNHQGANLALADYYQKRGDLESSNAHQSMINGKR